MFYAVFRIRIRIRIWTPTGFVLNGLVDPDPGNGT